MYLNTLVNKNRCMSNLYNIEYEIILLSRLMSIYKNEFIDERIGDQNLESTIANMINYFNTALCNNSSDVVEAVAQGYMHLLDYWIKSEYGIEIQTIHYFLLNPLKAVLLKGEDIFSQTGAIHWLYFLLRGSVEQGYNELFKFLYSFIIDLLSQVNVIVEDYFVCISYLIQNGGIERMAKHILPIVEW